MSRSPIGISAIFEVLVRGSNAAFKLCRASNLILSKSSRFEVSNINLDQGYLGFLNVSELKLLNLLQCSLHGQNTVSSAKLP